MFERFNGNVVPFADESTSTNRTVFGSETQSDDIDDNLNADFKKGWEIVGLNDNPTMEDFNAMGYTLGYLTSYLYQNGVAEYNLLQKYKTNSIAIGTDGNIYQSLVDNNLGNALTDTTKWVCIASKNSIVNSIAELKTISNIESINVLGYYEKGDGGGGTFYWDATSTESDNGGTIIQSTGVTTGRWKRVFSGAVNVKWFGAKGDGITDDMNAIKNTIKFCSYGGIVYVPSGTYIGNISAWYDGLDLPWFGDTNKPRVGFTIQGDGATSVIKSTGDYAFDIRYVQSYDQYGEAPTYLHIRDLSVISNKSGILLRSCQSVRLTNVQINSINSVASDYLDGQSLLLSSCGMFRVLNCYIRSGDSNTCGILLRANSSDAIIEGCDIAGGDMGVVFENAGDVRLIKNGIYGQRQYNILIDPTEEQDTAQLQITQNQIETISGATGIKINKQYSKICLDSMIYNNMIWLKSGTNGIVVDSSLNCSIKDNKFLSVGSGLSSGFSGILINSSEDIGIIGNNFKQLSQGATGIKVVKATRAYIKDNYFNNGISNTATTACIHIAGGTGNNNIQVAGNYDASYNSLSYFIKVDSAVAGGRYAYNKKNGSSLISIATDQYGNHFDTDDFYDRDGLKLKNSTYQYNRLIMGNYYLWVDTSGFLRIKNGAPLSNTDGTIVGTQS